MIFLEADRSRGHSMTAEEPTLSQELIHSWKTCHSIITITKTAQARRWEGTNGPCETGWQYSQLQDQFSKRIGSR